MVRVLPAGLGGPRHTEASDGTRAGSGIFLSGPRRNPVVRLRADAPPLVGQLAWPSW